MTLTLTFSSLCKRLTWKICILCTYMHFLQPTHQKTLGNAIFITNCLHSVSNKNQENIIINRNSQIWGLLPCQTTIINTCPFVLTISTRPGRIAIISPLRIDILFIPVLPLSGFAFNQTTSRSAAIWSFPRHCHLNSHSHCCVNLQSLCHHHHYWICH